MPQLYNYPTENSLQYQLDVLLSAGATSLTLNSNVSTKIFGPGIGWVDRIDASGNKTPSKREYFSFTGVSGTQLTGLSRGLAGSTDQEHAVGAIVEFGPDVLQADNVRDVITTEHTEYGVHASLPSLTLLTARDLTVNRLFNTSGASLYGFPLHPVWVVRGSVSAASALIGPPLSMPTPGTLEFISVVSRTPTSAASLFIDINKNNTTIFTDQNTRLYIPSGGTYVSTASIAVKSFNAGDLFTVDFDTGGGSAADFTIMMRAR